jgi:hypothetical protein
MQDIHRAVSRLRSLEDLEKDLKMLENADAIDTKVQISIPLYLY